MTRNKKIFLISAIGVLFLLFLAGILYYSQMLKYKTRFFPGTWINGKDVSKMTPGEVEESFTREAQEYTLKLVERNGEEEVLSAADVGLEIKCTELESILDGQEPLYWIVGLFEKSIYEVTPVAVYDEEKLKGAVSKLKCAAPDSQVEPTGCLH